jgi:hypothetical protein
MTIDFVSSYKRIQCPWLGLNLQLRHECHLILTMLNILNGLIHLLNCIKPFIVSRENFKNLFWLKSEQCRPWSESMDAPEILVCTGCMGEFNNFNILRTFKLFSKSFPILKMNPRRICISLARLNPGSVYNTCWNARVALKINRQITVYYIHLHMY